MSKFDTPYSTLPSEPSLATSSSLALGSHSGNAPSALAHTGSNDHLLPNYGEEPPEFTLYEAESFQTGSGNTVSHDEHLNEDGEALYRFLLSQATTPPKLTCSIKGTHTETRTRLVTSSGSHHHGSSSHHHSSSTRTETYTETVTDFSFTIDLSQHLFPVQHYTVSDADPAYRGKMVREVDEQDGISLKRRKATKLERAARKEWEKEIDGKGYPPWTRQVDLHVPGRAGLGPSNLLRSSRSMRQWADDYCASDKMLKEFVYEKMVYGWDLAALKISLNQLIKSTHYNGQITLDFPIQGSEVSVRPTNRLSRTLSNKWLLALLWITLIYPFIWLFKRFNKRGGGDWRVCGGAYALKKWTHVPDSHPGEDIMAYLLRTEPSTQKETYSDSDAPPPFSATDPWINGQPSRSNLSRDANLRLSRLRSTPQGISECEGVREGEWFLKWQGTIRRAVQSRLVQGTWESPLYDTDTHQAAEAGIILDGFGPAAYL